MGAEMLAREIIKEGGQILLPFEAGDAKIWFDSRRKLADLIKVAIRAAETRGYDRAKEAAAMHLEWEENSQGRGESYLHRMASEIREMKDKNHD